MKTTKQILPGVKEIGWVRCEHLVNDIALRGIAMMPVPILTDIHNVPFFDEPTCECVTENDGDGAGCICEITHKSIEPLALSHK